MKNIEAGQGLGSVKFGMQKSQVLELLGEPNDKETVSLTGGEGDMMETWHYDELEISLGFDEEEDWRLISLGVSAPSYLFEGKELLGKKRDDVEAILEESPICDWEFEDLSSEENPAQCLIASEEFEVNMWFEEDVLTEIQWGPLFSDDDTIVWPK